MYMTTGAKIVGIWKEGKMIEGKLTFADNLDFKPEEDWDYCKSPDRFVRLFYSSFDIFIEDDFTQKSATDFELQEDRSSQTSIRRKRFQRDITIQEMDSTILLRES
jgi:hypothetical protein